MDIDLLKMFMCVAETRSFSAAAEIQNVSQSSLSKAIIRLEDELGVKLFDRSHHPITLTDPGRVLAKELGDLEPLYMQMMDKVKRYACSDQISLCMVPGALSFNFKHMLWAFGDVNPNIVVQKTEKNELSEIGDLLQAGLLDFVITRHPTKVYPRYHRTVLDYDELIVVMPPNHQLADRQSVTLDDIANEKIFVSDYSTGIMEYLKTMYHFVPRKTVYKPNEKVHVSIAGLGHREGICIFYNSDLKVFRIDSVATARLSGIMQLPITLLENENNDRKGACKVFRDFILDHM